MKTELETKRDALREHRDKTDNEIAELNKQIQAEKKPKLRHGDYAITDVDWYSHGQVYFKDEKEILRTATDTKTQIHLKPSKETGFNGRMHVIGNIFDDLKALSEDVTEFEITNDCRIPVECKLKDCGGLKIKQGYEDIIISAKSVPEFILGLRQVEAEQKRRTK